MTRLYSCSTCGTPYRRTQPRQHKCRHCQQKAERRRNRNTTRSHYNHPTHRAAQRHAKTLTGTACPQCEALMDATNPPHADHITPLALGGTTTPDNYQFICRACNLTKHNQR